MNEPKFRVKYIDAAKFFGILFIVIGHVLRNGFFRQVIYAFNVPLFFFFAGITFDLQNKELTHFVKRKIERIYFPYIVFSIISIVIFHFWGQVAIKYLDVSVENRPILICLIEMLYGNSRWNNSMMWNRPLWFLPSSMSMFFLMILVEKTRVKEKAYKLFVIFLVSVAVAITAGVSLNILVIYPLPFSIEQAFVLIPFFILGNIFIRRNVYEVVIKKIKKLEAIFFLLVTLLCMIICSYYNGYVDVRELIFGNNVLLFYLSSIFGIICIILLAYVFEEKKHICAVGSSTLIILLLHKFPILFFQVAVPFTRNILKEGNKMVCILVSILCSIVVVEICYFLGNVKKILAYHIVGKKLKD